MHSPLWLSTPYEVSACVRASALSDAVGKVFAKAGIHIRQEMIIAVIAEVTDHVTRQVAVDDLLMQVLQMFRQTRKAVDELLTARFMSFDEVNISSPHTRQHDSSRYFRLKCVGSIEECAQSVQYYTYH